MASPRRIIKIENGSVEDDGVQVVGDHNRVEGLNNFIKGNHNNIKSLNIVKVKGNHNIIKGPNVTVDGNHNKISSEDATVIGNHNFIIGKRPLITGNWNIYEAADAIVVGSHNSRSVSQSCSDMHREDRARARDRDAAPAPAPAFSHPRDQVTTNVLGRGDGNEGFVGRNGSRVSSSGSGPNRRLLLDGNDVTEQVWNGLGNPGFPDLTQIFPRIGAFNMGEPITERFPVLMNRDEEIAMSLRQIGMVPIPPGMHQPPPPQKTVFPAPWADEPTEVIEGMPTCLVCMQREPIVSASGCGHVNMCVKCCLELKETGATDTRGGLHMCIECRAPVLIFTRLIKNN